MFVFSQVAKADSFDFTFASAGGPPPPAFATGPYADGSLVLTTADPGCSAGCIQVSLTAATGFLFETQGSGAGVFAFNTSTGSSLLGLAVINASSGLSNTLLTDEEMDGFGDYQYAVATTPINAAGAIPSIEFDLADTAGFTSVAQLEGLDSSGSKAHKGEYEFAAHECADTRVTCDDPVATSYIGANVTASTPENGTASLTLAGLGMIAVLMWKRRQDASRQPQAN